MSVPSKQEQIARREQEADQLEAVIQWAKTFDGKLTRRHLRLLNMVRTWAFKPASEPVKGDEDRVIDSVLISTQGASEVVENQDDMYRIVVGWWLPAAEKQLTRARATVEW